MAQIIETATGTIEKGEVDPVTLDLIENGLRNARYEMDEVLFRTALSPGIREQHDEFPLIGDPEGKMRSEEHTSELQSRQYIVCRLLLEKRIAFMVRWT